MPPGRVPITHPTIACHNCRRKRRRCDRSVPSCLKCSENRETCDGYSKQLTWIGVPAVKGDLAKQLCANTKPDNNSVANAEPESSEQTEFICLPEQKQPPVDSAVPNTVVVGVYQQAQAGPTTFQTTSWEQDGWVGSKISRINTSQSSFPCPYSLHEPNGSLCTHEGFQNLHLVEDHLCLHHLRPQFCLLNKTSSDIGWLTMTQLSQVLDCLDSQIPEVEQYCRMWKVIHPDSPLHPRISPRTST